MHKDSSSYVGYQLFFVNKVVSFVDILPFNTKMTSKFVTHSVVKLHYALLEQLP